MALTGELCKRLLICESHVEKLGGGGGWLEGLQRLTRPSVDFFFLYFFVWCVTGSSRLCLIAGGANSDGVSLRVLSSAHTFCKE